MPMPQTPPTALVDLVAERFRLIGEPMRIRLLDRLRAGDASVGELAEALEASQQNISKHLAALHRAGVVGRRKSGTSVVYSIADDSIFLLCDIVCGDLQGRLAELSQILAAPSGLSAAPAASGDRNGT
jgi:DNA-binding transcriptional ArsR family regulator